MHVYVLVLTATHVSIYEYTSRTSHPDPHQDVLQLSCLGQKANTTWDSAIVAESKPTFSVYHC
jgi:hypothetical protein